MTIRFASVPDDITRALDTGLSSLAGKGALIGHWSNLADGELDVAGPFGVYNATAAEIARGGLKAARLIGYRFLLLRDGEALASADLQRLQGGVFELAAIQDGPALAVAFEAFQNAEATLGDGDYDARFLIAPELGLSLVWFAGAGHHFAGAPDGSIDEEALIGRALRAVAPAKPRRQAPNVLRGVSLATAAAPNDSQPQTKVLNFLIQSQQMANWCWAAVTSSVYGFFTGDSAKWSQCILANLMLTQTVCCETPWIAACDQASSPASALAQVGCLDLAQTRAASQSETEAYINVGNPVGVGISSGGNKHAMTIYGYTQTGGPNDIVYIGDPWPTMGYSAINFNQFPGSYGAGGAWIQTWVTRPPA